ncbi:MAG: GHKL domain-containing protein [Clostridium sp.]|nr:GHKL domain-containing protein [Clostridium sp.]
MSVVLEVFYNVVESCLIIWLFSSYFGIKKEFDSRAAVSISFGLHLAVSTVITIFHVSWFTNFIAYTAVILIFSQLFFKGSLMEHLLLDIIANIILALTNLYIFTFIGKLLGIEYDMIAHQSSMLRFISVIITKVVYFIMIAVILSFKKKSVFMLRKIEYIFIMSTLIVSFIMIALVRNIIYDAGKYYNIFLLILLCVLLLNIGQFLTIIYISKKNITEQRIVLMKKQIEMQESNLHNLEEKYEETVKIRHDMKNYVSCALNMAEQTEHDALKEYLKQLSEEKMIPADSYVKTNRNVLNAVINTKSELAKKRGFDIHCIVTDEMENISDLDVGILLANLLDNAIEACEKNQKSSVIILKIWRDAGYYCIELSNSVESNVLLVNPRLTTSKNDKRLHGIGLKSVHSIVEKYNGMINFHQKSNKFYVYVSLCRYNI